MSNQCHQKSSQSDGSYGHIAQGKPEPLDQGVEQSAISPSTVASPKPLGQTVFERLNNRVQQGPADLALDRQHQLLEALGRHLRQWRLKQCYPRQELAAKLQLSVDQLLCIENGIGAPGDITEAQLHSLTTLLIEDETAISLKELIQHYLISLKS